MRKRGNNRSPSLRNTCNSWLHQAPASCISACAILLPRNPEPIRGNNTSPARYWRPDFCGEENAILCGRMLASNPEMASKRTNGTLPKSGTRLASPVYNTPDWAGSGATVNAGGLICTTSYNNTKWANTFTRTPSQVEKAVAKCSKGWFPN